MVSGLSDPVGPRLFGLDMVLARLRRLFGRLIVALLWTLPAVPARADVAALLSGTLNDHISIMLLIEPETGAIIDANDAAARFYGYALPQLRSMKIQDINTLGPDEVGEERRRAKAEKRNYFIFPHRLASGELRTVEVYSAPLRDAGGRTLLLSIVHDITGKAVADAELSAYRLRLEELVTRRTAEALDAQNRLRFWMVLGLALQTVLIVALVIAVIRRHAAVKEVAYEAHTRRRAEEKLALANADLQRFAEIAAHHLQEPTRRLMVFTQRLAKVLGPRHDENVAFSLATIEEQAGYLHALVRDVQVFLAAGAALGPVTATDPARIIEQIRADQRQRFADAQTELQVDDLPRVRMDSPRLRYLPAPWPPRLAGAHPCQRRMPRRAGIAARRRQRPRHPHGISRPRARGVRAPDRPRPFPKRHRPGACGGPADRGKL